MELTSGCKPHQSTLQLDNLTEARLFISDGVGILSLQGLKLFRESKRAQLKNDWPIEVTMGHKLLEHTVQRMTEEAARLSAYQTLKGFGEYPNALEDEFALRTMATAISEHLVSAAPKHG